MQRGKALTVMGLAAGAVAVASAAYACVPFTGKVSWEGNKNGYAGTPLSVMGDWTSHGYCNAPPDWTNPGADPLGEVATGSGSTAAAQVQVSVGPPPVGDACDFQSGGNNNQLADSGTNANEKYVLAVRNNRGEMPEGSTTNNSCYQANGVLPTGVSILNSNITVTGGSGTIAQFNSANFNANQAGTYSMCISRSAIQSGSYRSAIGWNIFSL